MLKAIEIAQICGATIGSFKQYPDPLTKTSLGLYMPHLDVITLRKFKGPLAEKLTTSVIFHELSHWSGHPNRLARKRFLNPFPSWKVARHEEWIADMCSFMLLRYFGFTDRWYEENIRHRLKNLSTKEYNKVQKEARSAARYIITLYQDRKEVIKNELREMQSECRSL